MPDSDGGSVQPGLSAPACSDWARSQYLDPVGSSGHYQGFLLVEQPLPWPFDVSSIPELVEMAKLAVAAGLRVQTVIPVDQEDIAAPTRGAGGDGPDGPERRPAAETLRRVICYRLARPGWAGPLVRSERAVEPGSLADAASEMLGQSPSVEGPGDAADVIDVLVCTHGRRDACCGSRGMDLVTQLSFSPRFGGQAGVRLWRTSHTGGHRFAPTAVLLPSGTMWAWADVPLLQAATFAEGDVGEWLGRYRGCATIGSPSQQAVERAVVAEVGWELMGSWRRASDIGDGVVRL